MKGYSNACTLYYKNACITFHVSLLTSGDVENNPGPSPSMSADKENAVCSYNNNTKHTYSISNLLQLNPHNVHSMMPLSKNLRVDDVTWQQITSLQINRVKKTHRGKRAGRQQREKAEKLSTSNAHLDTDSSSPNIKFAMLNARSVKNKTAELVDYVVEHELDIVAICETWLSPDDAAPIGQLTPRGFNLKHIPRTGRRGGGVAVLFKNQLDVRILDTPNITSFEMIQMTMNHKQKTLHLIVQRNERKTDWEFL